MDRTQLLASLTTLWDKPSSAYYYNDILDVDILWAKISDEVNVTLDSFRVDFDSLDDALDYICQYICVAYPTLTTLE